MDNQLQTTLQRQIQSGWQSNPATHQIITSYARYHAVVAIVGSLFLLILLWLTAKFWIKFKKIPRIQRLKWPFEKKVYLCFASVFTLVVIFLGLIVIAANVSTAIKPLPGFSEAIPTLTDNSYNTQLHKAFNEWILSGKSTPPVLVQQRIHHRRVFHTTRVMVGAVLLVTFTMLSVRLWKTLIGRRNASETKWTLKEVVWLLAGIVSVASALFMMIVVLANLQSAIVPIANTLQFG
jgi:Ca2+/Na+ antiporter